MFLSLWWAMCWLQHCATTPKPGLWNLRWKSKEAQRSSPLHPSHPSDPCNPRRSQIHSFSVSQVFLSRWRGTKKFFPVQELKGSDLANLASQKQSEKVKTWKFISLTVDGAKWHSKSSTEKQTWKCSTNPITHIDSSTLILRTKKDKPQRC